MCFYRHLNPLPQHSAAVATIIALACLLLPPTLFSATLNHLESNKQPALLLELFTSQGCSSCPPADQWLTQFKTDPALWQQVIPLAYHVTYWDWIGWKDALAKKQFDARQRQYHQRKATRSVYTPGFVADGKEWRGWFSRSELPRPGARSGTLSADIEDHRISIMYSVQSGPEAVTFHTALLGFDLKTPVLRGENTNRTLKEDFVVLWYREAKKDLQTGLETQLMLPQPSSLPGNRYGIAIWVTDSITGEILQTVGGWI